ncbi:hypothetical protein [Streptomyces fumanus]
MAQLPLPYQQTVSAMAAQRLPQAEGYRLDLHACPDNPGHAQREVRP